MANTAPPIPRIPDLSPGLAHRFLFLSDLLKKPVYALHAEESDRIGRLTDLVVQLKEPFPEVVGLYLEHGWGHPTEFVSWQNVLRIEDDGFFVSRPSEGGPFPPFVDQQGWLLLEQHLLGKSILDLDGRRTEVVNDIHFLEAKGRLLLVHVDTSFNGFLRRWGLSRLKWRDDDLISWKFVQPLTVEDAVATDTVTLSVARTQLAELPAEDLADALEELTGEKQEALFSALDSEKAAETLVEAEPRAQRQLIGLLLAVHHANSAWKERARTILSEMSVPQLATLLSVLPHDDVDQLLALLPAERQGRVKNILSDQEPKARDLISSDWLAVSPTSTVGDALALIRGSGKEPGNVSYLYCVKEDGKTLEGVIDLRALVLAPDKAPASQVMVSPVVTADAAQTRDDIAEIFSKYHYRMLPVVDEQDRILGVIRYNEIMKGTTGRARE